MTEPVHDGERDVNSERKQETKGGQMSGKVASTDAAPTTRGETCYPSVCVGNATPNSLRLSDNNEQVACGCCMNEGLVEIVAGPFLLPGRILLWRY